MTVRAILVTSKPDKHERCPIKIVVTIKGKRTYQSTGIRIKEDEWNGEQVKKTVKNARTLNQVIQVKIKEAEGKLMGAVAAGTNLRSALKKNTDEVTIADYFKRLIKEIGKKKYSPDTISSFEFEMKRLKKFAPHITFNDVDHSFLRRYENHLRGKNLSGNTIHKIWKRLRKLFNSARKEGITDNYPFNGYDNPKYRQTQRTFLLIEEVEKLEQLLNQPMPEYFRVTINYFLLGAYSGLRFSDWQRFNYEGFIQGERIILGAKKNGEIIGMKMHDKLKAVVERLRTLPPIYSEPTTNDYLKSIATLASIKKILTTHVARHSYATHSLRLKIPDDVIAHTMGVTLKTLQIYKHLLNSSVDEELEKWNC